MAKHILNPKWCLTYPQYKCKLAIHTLPVASHKTTQTILIYLR